MALSEGFLQKIVVTLQLVNINHSIKYTMRHHTFPCRTLLFFLLAVTALGAAAQYVARSQGNNRYHRRGNYSDVYEVRMSRAGTLEKELGQKGYDMVRLLRIDGTINNDGFFSMKIYYFSIFKTNIKIINYIVLIS